MNKTRCSTHPIYFLLSFVLVLSLILAVILVGAVALSPGTVGAEDGEESQLVQDVRGIRMEGLDEGEPVKTDFGSPPEGIIYFEQTPTPPEDLSWQAYTSSSTLAFRCIEDFWGLSENITDIHWYGFSLYWESGWYECDPTDMLFEIIFYQDSGGAPGAPVATFSDITPTCTYYGSYDSFSLYRFDIASLPTAVSLTEGWVSIQSTYSPSDCNFLWMDSPDGNWNAIQEGVGELSNNLAFELTGQGFEYGDAPEDALAYPYSLVNGAFPTCKNVPTAGYIEHNNFGAWFGPTYDFEGDGNGGCCPLFNPDNYDQDECFNDGDAGLIKPEPYTLVGSTVVAACSGYNGSALGTVCQQARWGTDVDIDVHNTMPGHPEYLPAYVNVLVDWNQDGQWGGSCSCPGANTTPEHVLVNFVVPPLYIGTLSALSPADFTIGPKQGYVWTRFSITESEVPEDWDGSGVFEDGETEDYLLRIDGELPVGGIALPVDRFGLLLPWLIITALVAVTTVIVVKMRLA